MTLRICNPARRLTAAAAIAIACLTAACSGGGSSSGSGAGSVGSTSASSSGTSQAQWQLALAALGAQVPPLDLAIGPRATSAWNDLFAQSWPAFRAQEIDPRIEAALRQQLGALGQGALRVVAIRDLVLDTAAPPRLDALAFGTQQRLTAALPGHPGTWRIGFTADVHVRIGSFPSPIALTVRAEANDVRIVSSGVLDTSNPGRPTVTSTSPPSVSLRLNFTSPSPILSQVTPLLTRILDPIIRVAVLAAGPFAQQQILQAAQAMNASPFGTGAAPTTGVDPTIDLEAIANEAAVAIRRDHMPWATILVPIMDNTTYGSGTAVRYDDFGDSAGWTGSYLSAEAMRFDVTGDALALAGATRAIDGLLTCLEVGRPGDGYLARTVIPVSSPHIQSIRSSPEYFEGVVDGVRYGATGNMSRDHYLMASTGFTQALLRLPTLRAKAADGLTRIVSYLIRNGWNVEFTPGSPRLSRASPFGQSPGTVLGMVRGAYLADPVRFKGAHDRYEAISEMLWLFSWASSREPMFQYYKFNLGHQSLLMLYAGETDAGRYRDYVRSHQMMRDTVGHHDNAWFDSLWGAAVPAAAPVMGPRLRNELERWSLRPRRAFDTRLPQDPSIAKVVYSSPLVLQPETVATLPVPIEKRPATDFLWQRSPFGLAGGHTNPARQYPALDLLLPYWIGRAYGLAR